MIPRSWCSHGVLTKARVILNPNRKATVAAATRSCLMRASHEQTRYIRSGASQRLLGTSSSTAAFTTLQQQSGGGRGGGEGDGSTAKGVDSSADAPTGSPTSSVSTPYALPVPSWSLADLKLVRRVPAAEDDDEADRAVLTRDEVSHVLPSTYKNKTPGTCTCLGAWLVFGSVGIAEELQKML